MYECPNCRQPQPLRYVMKPIWGTWTCAACGAGLAISPKRRLIALMAVLFFVLLTVGAFGPAISSHGWVVRLAALPVLACGVLAIVLLFDRADLVDRTGMRCHRCGYDLRGQSETRCSECGAAFDPSEAARRAAAAEYQAAATRRRRVASAVLVAITVLGILVFLGNVLWWRAARRVPAAAPTATATPQTP